MHFLKMDNRREDEEEKGTRANKMDLAFSGAGFLGCYYFGVVDCWRKYVPRDRVNRVAGSSAGSLIAAYYLLEMPMEKCLNTALEMTEIIRKQKFGVFNRSYQIVDALPVALDKTFPDDAHKKVGNKLYVCMTRLKDMKKIVVNEFETKKDLIDALNCSCFVPVWSGNHAPTYKGEKHIDGGFTDGLPAFDERTIKVCCFSGDSDISPYDKMRFKVLSRSVANLPVYANLNNIRRGKVALTPITIDKVVPIIKGGFRDTKNFLLANDLIQCDRCYNNTDPSEQPVYSRPSPCITPRATSPASERRNVRDANSLSPDDNESFRKLLNGKLARHTSNLVQGKDPPVKSNNPEIKISEPEESARRKGSVQSLQGDRTSAKERRRRSTCARLTTALEDRFISSLEPLPSCPPSPTLNRHCKECGRLRQKAGSGDIDESLQAELDRLMAHAEPRKIKRGLGHPFKWIKQIGKKNSYDIARHAV